MATPSSALAQRHLQIEGQYQRPLVCVQISGPALSSYLPEVWPNTIPMELIDAHEQPYERVLDAVLSSLGPNEAEEETLPPELDREPRSPYKGLRAFTQADAADFFGRESLIKELHQQVAFLSFAPNVCPHRRCRANHKLEVCTIIVQTSGKPIAINRQTLPSGTTTTCK